jgi:putative nucleotide binding protein
MKQAVKEEHAIILDFLPHGYPFDTRPMHRKMPVAQAIGRDHFILLELVPKKGITLQPNQVVYMGEGKRDEIHHIVGKITLDKLTQTAKGELEFIIKDLVEKNEQRFVKFFNEAQPINIRRHQLELLPGIGKKHMFQIIEERERKIFASFEDIKTRVKLLPDPEKSIIKRILLELNNEDKYKIFVDSPIA